MDRETSMKAVRVASVCIALSAGLQAAGQPARQIPAGNAARLFDSTYALLVQHRTHYAFDTYVADDLIQHNPSAKDGRAAAIAMVSPLISAPGAQFTVSNVIADGDFGFIYYRGLLGGPGHGAAVAELYRLHDGKFVEHWDAFQPIPDKPVSAHPMFGPLPATLPKPCTGASAADRALVNSFADLLYRRRHIRAAFENYAAPDMIQHDPGLPDGTAAAIAELGPILSRPATSITIAHVLACQGYGVIHLRSHYGSSPGHVIFDIMRIERGRIVEHWDVFQPISPSSVNPREPL
jgi:predicted SnoaL-like aldol condensation-catalyzing enzyme